MIELREGSPLAVPHDGPMPWVVRIVLRRTVGGRPLAGLGGEEELMRVTLQPHVVRQLGGPSALPGAMESDRRRFARGAIAAGYRDGWAVEIDVERGHRRRIWEAHPERRLELPGGIG